MQFAIYFDDLLMFNLNDPDKGCFCQLSEKIENGSESTALSDNK